jgi:hypothetical protein
MKPEHIFAIFNNLSDAEKIEFFAFWLDGNSPEDTVYKTFINNYKHDELQDIAIYDNNRMIIANDFIENGEEDVDNYVTIYSNRKSNIAKYIKQLFEDGEIIQTVEKRLDKRGHCRKIRSLNFDGSLPIVPIVYN